MANIFGITRQVVSVGGIPLVQKNSLTPVERIDLQEKFDEAKNEFNRRYYDLVLDVQTTCSFKSEAEAYGAVKRYFAGQSENEDVNNAIELLSLKNPIKAQKDVELEELTYLLNARIDRATFPAADFEEAFGLKFEGYWTLAHTIAIGDLLPEVRKFFDRESGSSSNSELASPDEGKSSSD